MSGIELTSLIVLCLIAWFWLESIKVREIGIDAARSSCVREGVQLLDDTVAIRSLRFARDDNGHLRLRRVYDFEYSGSGYDRQRGSVVMLGRDVVLLDVGVRRPPPFMVH
jgi:hypothetical protein